MLFSLICWQSIRRETFKKQEILQLKLKKKLYFWPLSNPDYLLTQGPKAGWLQSVGGEWLLLPVNKSLVLSPSELVDQLQPFSFLILSSVNKEEGRGSR